MKKYVLGATIVALLSVGVVVAPAPSASAATITPGSQHWMYAGAGSGKLGNWNALGRSTSTDGAFATARAGVWVYGDSLTRADYATLAASLTARGIPSAVDAQGGLPTVPAVDRLAARVARQGAPRVLVMATGSNDIFRPTFIGPASRRVRTVVGPGTKIVWVNAYVKRTSASALTQTYDLRNTRTVNAAIAAAPTDRVVDWYGFLLAKSSRPGAYLRDGVHTSSSGQAARNALIVAQVTS